MLVLDNRGILRLALGFFNPKIPLDSPVSVHAVQSPHTSVYTILPVPFAVYTASHRVQVVLPVKPRKCSYSMSERESAVFQSSARELQEP
jgi:hypothetical protein